MVSWKGTVEIMDLSSFYKNKKVLVTGHTGFKGTWLCLWLQHLGADVYGYALAPTQGRPSLFELTNLEKSVTSNIADIRNQETLSSFVKKIPFDIVFHLAAQPLVRDSYSDPVFTYDTNVMGTIYLLETLRQCASVQSAIFITTDKCYQNNEWSWPYRENDRLGGNDPYSSSKAMAELAVNAYRKSFFKESPMFLATARGGNVIGGGDFSKDRIIPDIIESLQKERPVVLRNPQAVRPWQHVLDAIYGYLVLCKKGFEKTKPLSLAYNFSSNENTAIYTVQRITEYFIKNIGSGQLKIDTQNNHPHEATLLCLDSSLALKELHWKPKYTIEASIQLTADWYKAYLNDSTSVKELTLSQIKNYMKDPM